MCENVGVSVERAFFCCAEELSLSAATRSQAAASPLELTDKEPTSPPTMSKKRKAADDSDPLDDQQLMVEGLVDMDADSKVAELSVRVTG